MLGRFVATRGVMILAVLAAGFAIAIPSEAQTDRSMAYGQHRSGAVADAPIAGEASGAGATEKVFWANQNRELFRGNPDGAETEVIASGNSTTQNGIAIDHEAGKVYFGAFLQVYRCALNGSELETVVTFPAEPLVQALAIDPVSRMLYIGRYPEESGLPSKIDRASLDGPLQPETIYQTPDAIWDLDIDPHDAFPAARKLYWIELRAGSHRIRCANLDGTNAEDVLTGLGFPVSLAVHPADGDLYWVNFGTAGPETTDGSVRRALGPSFTTIETLVTGLNDATELAMDTTGTRIYFVDNYRTLMRSALNGSLLQTQFTLTDGQTFGGLGLTTVAACAPGSFSEAGGESPCSPCSPGTYQPLGGQTACVACACDDGDSCTLDTCDPVTGGNCQNTAIVSSPPVLQRQFDENGDLSGAPEPKSRYLAVRAGDPGVPQAIRVTWEAMPNWATGHGELVGQVKWMTEPQQACENPGQRTTVTPPDCGGAAGLPQRWYWYAHLTCDPAEAWFGDLVSLTNYCSVSGEACATDADCALGRCGVDGVIHLVDSGIAPSRTAGGIVEEPAQYRVDVIAAGCSLTDDAAYSDPLETVAAGWGDAVGLPGLCPANPPNADSGLVGDVTECLRKFIGAPCAPKKSRCDMNQDFFIGFPGDVVPILQAFSNGGDGFYHPAPAACPAGP